MRTGVWRVPVAYLLLALLAFPITEILVAGANARQYAHDVFDDGSVARLGAIVAEWRSYGPTFWDPYLTSGNAWWGQFAFPPISLDTLLTAVAPPFTAYALTYFALVVVAGWAMHIFLRDAMGLTEPAAAAGGIIATFGFWHYVIGFAVALLPLSLLLLYRRSPARIGGARSTVALGLVAGFMLYTSQLQVAAIVATVQLAWILALPAAGRAERLRMWLLGWLIGGSLYAPALITQAVHLSSSHRSGWRLSELVAVGRLPTPTEAAERYASVFLGLPVIRGLGGSPGSYGTWFLGIASLLAAVVGTLCATRRPFQLFVVLLVAIPVVDLLAVALLPAYEGLPLIGSFQFVRVRHLMPFVLAVLAAIGIDALFRREPRWWGGRRAAAVVLGAVAVGLCAQLALAAVRAIRLTRGAPARPLEAEGMTLGLASLVAGAVAVTLVVAWLLRRYDAGASALRAVPTIVLVAALGLLVADRALYARAERDLASGLGTFAESLGETRQQASILAAGSGRTISLDDHPNRMLFARIRAADGYQNIYPVRYHDLFGILIEPNLAHDQKLKAYYEAWGNRAYAFGHDLRRPILDLLDVSWIVSDGGAKGNPTAFGRAFIVRDVRLHETTDALLESLRTATSEELRGAADLLRSEAAGAQSLSGGAPGSATVTLDTPDRVVVEASADGPALLVLTDTFAPGWEARVGGEDAPILPAYRALRGVVIQAGSSTVEFVYRPWFTWLGLAWAAATVLSCLLVLLWHRRAGR